MMMIGKNLVAVLAISTLVMMFMENVEGGREMGLKEATKAYNGHVSNENVDYKPKEEDGCDGYKYKDKDCYEYGNCGKSPYPDYDDGQYNWNSHMKPVPKPKEMDEKYKNIPRE
ncbi:Seed nucellus-specific protein [Cucumis melo var. makuwa]|uniref:Seed nucellus-specific protein n=1 Tax=Cucumis melo var. makuwa TaxID=1194695 RepID=A0A5D3CS37_CUCMM|nr:Seed nucellus-specific protein [Cucumis melo var. makuwa]